MRRTFWVVHRNELITPTALLMRKSNSSASPEVAIRYAPQAAALPTTLPEGLE